MLVYLKDRSAQFYVLPHWERSCRPNFLSHPVTVYWHRANHDPITPGAWQGRRWSANFKVNGMTRLEKIPAQAGSNPGSSALEADALSTSVLDDTHIDNPRGHSLTLDYCSWLPWTPSGYMPGWPWTKTISRCNCGPKPWWAWTQDPGHNIWITMDWAYVNRPTQSSVLDMSGQRQMWAIIHLPKSDRDQPVCIMYKLLRVELESCILK